MPETQDSSVFFRMPFRTGLSFRINLIIVIGLILFMVIPSLILVRIHIERLKDHARDDAEYMTDLFAKFSQEPLARQAYGVLVYNAESLLENSQVLFVEVYDADGMKVVPSKRPRPQKNGDILILKRDVVEKRLGLGYVGQVEIGFDLAPLYGKFSQLFDLLIVGIFSASAGLIFSLTVLLRQFVGKPVQRLVRSVQAIATGDLEHRVEGLGEDELGELARNINAMTASLASTMQARQDAEVELSRLNRELEEKVRERTAQLAEKAVELEALNRHLQDLDEIKSSLLSQVSHELRTPLTSVLGFTKLIAKDFDNTFTPLAVGRRSSGKKARRIMDNLRIIQLEGERLTRLINELLDLNKIESGNMVWNDREVDLVDLIDLVLKAVSGFFEVREDVVLASSVPPDLPRIHADPDRIEQVLINLINNAAKFTVEGSVSVSASRLDDAFVEIRVTDTGVGIRKEDCGRIFEKFTQAKQEDDGYILPQGTGLGLAICKEIVEHYRGSIRVESEVGKGSSFIILFPSIQAGD